MSGTTMLIFRLVHIVSSVFWAGGAVITFAFIEPTAKSLAPTGMQFLQYMVKKRRFSLFMVISSTLTVLSGASLLWVRASGQWLSYVNTGPGLGFILGSATGVAVYFVGLLGVNPRALKLAKIGDEIQAAGGPPTPDQGALMHKLDREMSAFGIADFILVILSLVFMASARYWLF
jgi:uncharacterized membrane protein